jgi:hypothetical protein
LNKKYILKGKGTGRTYEVIIEGDVVNITCQRQNAPTETYSLFEFLSKLTKGLYIVQKEVEKTKIDNI